MGVNTKKINWVTMVSLFQWTQKLKKCRSVMWIVDFIFFDCLFVLPETRTRIYYRPGIDELLPIALHWAGLVRIDSRIPDQDA